MEINDEKAIKTSLDRAQDDHYWTELEIQELEKINSFEEMVPVATRILARMKEAGLTVVQLCGPMSTGGKGSLEANMKYFHRAIDVARSNGLHPFDQTPFQDAMARLANKHHKDKEYCMDILHIFYRGIFASGLVSKLLFLPDWQSSRGATWEHDEAPKHGLPVEDYPAEWLPLLEETK